MLIIMIMIITVLLLLLLLLLLIIIIITITITITTITTITIKHNDKAWRGSRATPRPRQTTALLPGGCSGGAAAEGRRYTMLYYSKI